MRVKPWICIDDAGEFLTETFETPEEAVQRAEEWLEDVLDGDFVEDGRESQIFVAKLHYQSTCDIREATGGDMEPFDHILYNPRMERIHHEEAPELAGHNCDEMGCGQCHVLFRLVLPAESSYALGLKRGAFRAGFRRGAQEGAPGRLDPSTHAGELDR